MRIAKRDVALAKSGKAAGTSKAKATRGTATKSAKATASTAASEGTTRKTTRGKKAAQAFKAFSHVSKGSTPFSNLPAGSQVRGAILLGALVAAGMAKLSRNGQSVTTTRKGSADMFKRLAGNTAYTAHKRQQRFDGEGLTKEGATFFSQRIVGKAPTFNTDAETVAAVIAAMQSGGTVSGVKFDKAVEVANG